MHTIQLIFPIHIAATLTPTPQTLFQMIWMDALLFMHNVVEHENSGYDNQRISDTELELQVY